MVCEHELLADGLSADELRALRLLDRAPESRSDAVYLAHVELISRAAGRSGELARMVKITDLEDRLLHPRVRPDGWSPPMTKGWSGSETPDRMSEQHRRSSRAPLARRAAGRRLAHGKRHEDGGG